MKAILRFPRLSGWMFFLFGFGALIACDYGLRMRDGQITSGGIPETLWFALQWVLAAGALCLIWRGTRSRTRPWLGFAELAAHAALGFLLYLWIGLYYVLGTGIDSL